MVIVRQARGIRTHVTFLPRDIRGVQLLGVSIYLGQETQLLETQNQALQHSHSPRIHMCHHQALWNTLERPLRVRTWIPTQVSLPFRPRQRDLHLISLLDFPIRAKQEIQSLESQNQVLQCQ